MGVTDCSTQCRTAHVFGHISPPFAFQTLRYSHMRGSVIFIFLTRDLRVRVCRIPMVRCSFRSFTCRTAGRARPGECRVCRETFAALPSLGRGGHFRSLSPTFGAEVLSQH
eukprot:3232787-Prymnesium_polylepis.1